jgi:hypothetical protein
LVQYVAWYEAFDPQICSPTPRVRTMSDTSINLSLPERILVRVPALGRMLREVI